MSEPLILEKIKNQIHENKSTCDNLGLFISTKERHRWEEEKKSQNDQTLHVLQPITTPIRRVLFGDKFHRAWWYWIRFSHSNQSSFLKIDPDYKIHWVSQNITDKNSSLDYRHENKSKV